jgi:pimeloyl-ACP methyl ester carboxylesterase
VPPASTLVASGAAQISCELQGDGPPVLLMHAGVTDKRSWGPLVAALAGRHRTVAYDQRGFGETIYEPEPHSAVGDAVAVLDATGVDRAMVVGASNGGRRAVDLALAYPDRVLALVLIGAGLRGGPEDDLDAFSEAVRALYAAYEAAEAGDDPDELNRVEAHAWLDGWSAPEGRVQGPVRDLFLDMNRIAMTAPSPGDDGSVPAWDRLGAVAVPTLVLVGALDDLCRPTSEHLAREIPGATLEVLEGTGHLPHLEGHARCLEAIRAFLVGIER